MNVLNSLEEVKYIQGKYFLSPEGHFIFSFATNKAVKLKTSESIALYTKKNKKLSYYFWYMTSLLSRFNTVVPYGIDKSLLDRFKLIDFDIVRKRDSRIMNDGDSDIKMSFKNKTVRIPYFFIAQVLSSSSNKFLGVSLTGSDKSDESSLKGSLTPVKANSDGKRAVKRKVISNTKASVNVKASSVAKVNLKSTDSLKTEHNKKAISLKKNPLEKEKRSNFGNKSFIKMALDESLKKNANKVPLDIVKGNQGRDSYITLNQEFNERIKSPKNEYSAGFAFLERNQINIKSSL